MVAFSNCLTKDSATPDARTSVVKTGVVAVVVNSRLVISLMKHQEYTIAWLKRHLGSSLVVQQLFSLRDLARS